MNKGRIGKYLLEGALLLALWYVRRNKQSSTRPVRFKL